MIVDVVSPTPFALLRRARQFEYRDDDMALQHFAEFEDPIQALTEECRRVLRAISTTNQSHVSDAATSTSLKDPSWSRFEDIGFGSAFEDTTTISSFSNGRSSTTQGLNSTSRTPTNDFNRPTTPSWADFLSSGFVDENGNKAPTAVLLPPDKALPPMSTLPRGQSSQSHRRDLDVHNLEPGELASIAKVELDDAFWWVWITSLAGEEPVARKAAFGRCAVIETSLLGGQWMVMEEQVKGAAPEPAAGAYVAERKSFFSFTKKGRLTRRRSALKKSSLAEQTTNNPSNRTTLDLEKQAKIQKAAAELARKKRQEEMEAANQRRGRIDENASVKTSSVFTLGPVFKDEASPALQWAKQYDKKAIREQYLGNQLAGKGSTDFLTLPSGGLHPNRSTSTISIAKDLPPTPENGEPQSYEKAVSPPLSAISAYQPSQSKDVAEPVSPIAQGSTTSPSAHVAVTEPVPTLTTAPAPIAVHEASTESHSISNGTSDHQAGAQSATANRKYSNESKRSQRSGRSDKEKPQTEKSRLKKLGFNAPPPVATNKNGGIKKMFGTLRKHKDNSLEPPEHEDPAIAAARRALEGKPAQPGDGPTSPPLSPNHFAKMQNAAKSPSEVAKTQEPAAASISPVVEPSPTFAEPIEPREEPVVQQPEQIPEPVIIRPLPQDRQHENEFPSAPKSNEFDDLSQVDSRERATAVQEFSRFDQGPLLDQPAFAPNGYSDHDEYRQDDTPAFEPPMRPKHQSVYSAVTMQTDATDEEPEAEPVTQMSAHDRWAQIRRNAAERAARASEDHARSRTETRTTDDGETSGEESKFKIHPIKLCI